MSIELSDESKAHLRRYSAAAHAMQSGVAMKMGFAGEETEPKHLRVGVNSAMVEHAALVALLMEKGIITDEDYTKALADAMEREAENYRLAVSEHFGREVKLA